MPPQGYVVLSGLGANYVCSLLGLPTISQFARRHKLATALVMVGANAFLIPHFFRRIDDAIATFDNALEETP